MLEIEIVQKKVLPYLETKMNWPSNLISEYGRVPVQIGTSTCWADIVCSINKENKQRPWILIEVKNTIDSLKSALAQAESYALMLNAPFLCVTDGDTFEFYMTGTAQGTSIKLNSCPIPIENYLHMEVETTISYSQDIDSLIDSFISGLKNEQSFYEDTKEHFDSIHKMNNEVFNNLESVTPEILKRCINTPGFMMKTPNKNQIFSEIDSNFDKVKKFLAFLKDFPGDPVVNITSLLDKNNPLHIKGCGLFYITQFLAGASS
jgi:hypothetical protein